MQHLTGFNWLLVDAANQAGHDKLLWDQRIGWAMEHFDELETLDTPKKERPLFLKAVMAIRAAQRGEDIGHLVGLDACNSGAQIMSALTGCVAGCMATNLIMTGERRDGYTEVTKEASNVLGEGLVIARSDIKNAQMTHLYGSKAEPRALFGEDTPELAAFYQANWIVFPGANELLADLLNLWQGGALSHNWILPDNGHARVKVMQMVETRIEVDELDHATCTYEYAVNEGKDRDVKMAANVIHSIDAYVLRTMQRRCGYDEIITVAALDMLREELAERRIDSWAMPVEAVTAPHHIYMERFEASNMVDSVILPYINSHSIMELSTNHIEKLIALCELLLTHKPFDIVTVHDEFKCHPNNCNQMRRHYIEIFAELAESTILQDIFMQVCGRMPTYENKNPDLPAMIRQSEYPLS